MKNAEIKHHAEILMCMRRNVIM